MPVEDTDLERRVLAHEQILQALMAQLAEAEPGFLDRLRERFATARRGAHEHDYVETADYAEAFIHEVVRLGARGLPTHAIQSPKRSEHNAAAPETHEMNQPVVIRTQRAGGVWHVTCDDIFLGDYLAEKPARDAAMKVAHEIERRGGRAELVEARR